MNIPNYLRLFAFTLTLSLKAAPVVTVDTPLDENDGVAVGGISLRDAIAEVDSGGQILFHSTLSGETIYLQHDELLIEDKSIDIDASGLTKGITLNGSKNYRAFRLRSGIILNHTISLTNFTIEHCQENSGAAIYATGNGVGVGQLTLNLTDCHFARNHATINGGALHSDSNIDLNLTRSSICWNSSEEEGGGIYSSSTVSATNCTIAHNRSGKTGAALSQTGRPVQLTHCTITGNLSHDPTPSVIALRLSGHLYLYHTICAGNPTPNIIKSDFPSTITSQGHNIFGQTTPFYAINTDILTNDPKLELPMRRGGNTFTCAFRPDSPACNAGDSSIPPFLTPSTDQRGYPRLRDGFSGFFFDDTIDIGAYELGETITVNTAADENFTLPDSGLSLREAIAEAATNGPGTRITISPAISDLDQFTSEIVINSDLWLDGASRPKNWTINRDSSAGTFRIFSIASGKTCTIEATSLRDGVAPGTTIGSDGLGGGGILVKTSAHLNLVDSEVSNCYANSGDADDSGSGGGILIDGSSVFLLRSSVIDCNAGTRGGGIYVRGKLHAANSSIISNSALNIGGGIADHANDDILLEHCTITGNSNTQPGGAGLAMGATIPRIAFSVFSANRPQNYSSIFANSPVSLGINLEDGNAMFTGAGDILNTDPQLAPLPSYSHGNRTYVVVPNLNISPVIDIGPTLETYHPCYSLDQIGAPRIKQGIPNPVDNQARLDLGAVEAGGQILVTTHLDENDGPNSGTGTSLREAITLANSDPVEDIITFTAGPSPFKLTLDPSLGELPLTNPIQIIGANHSCYFTEISGKNQTRLFSNSSKATLRNLTLSRGSAAQGGALHLANNAITTISGCYFNNNTAQQGGAIFQAPGHYSEINITSSSFAYNRATGSTSSQSHGGALFLSPLVVYDLILESSTFYRNAADNDGSAIYGAWNSHPGGSYGINRLTIVANQGNGAIASPGGFYLNRSIIVGNSPHNFTPSQMILTSKDNILEKSHPGFLPTNNNLVAGPLLKPFGDYGGPTPTLALTNTSPAIDHNSLTGIPGQRGTLTQDGDNNSTAIDDAGAFEFVPPLIVTTNIDEQDGPSVGGLSLREAIDAASNTLHALIQFHPSLDGSTITLLTPDPLSLYSEALNVPLGSSITIDASPLPNGITITDDINEVPPHFGIPAAHDLIRFNLASGSFDDSYLGLENITFSMAGIHALKLAGNHHRIHNCLFKDNSEPGGNSALATGGHLELSNSTFLNNAATRGGALFNHGFGTVTQCTFNGNTAAEGAVIHNSGCLDFLNCTFAKNTAQDSPPSAAAGAIAYQESFGLSQSNQSANLAFQNCLFDNPITTALFASDSQFPGTISSLGRNLTRSAVPELNHPNDLTSTDTLLEPFASLPLPGSFPLIHSTDAVDVIVPSLSDPLVDQRGYRRPLDGNGDGFALSDIGAVEAPPVILVDTEIDENDGIGNGAGTSLRDAVAIMNSRNYSEMPVIGFASHLDGATIQLEAGPGGEILLSAEQKIDASSLANGITIAGSRSSGGGDYRVFQANAPGETIRLSCLTIEQGWANDWGGGLLVENATACVLTDCTVRDSFAVNLGGGIAVRSSAFLALERSTLSENLCDSLGGGLGVDGSFVQAINSTISGNNAFAGGGGIADVTLSDIDLQHTTIANNTSTSGGGGIDMIATAARTSHVLLVQNSPVNFHQRAPAGDITSSGYNLDDGTNGGFTQLTDRANVPGAIIEPLTNNGGRTQTHALLFNSPAIDAGDPGLATGGLLFTDQTGQNTRVMDGDYLAPETIDIGAFEFDLNTLPPDMDGDCIPNGAEVAMGFDPQDPADGLADQDGDLVPAGKEWLAGTDDHDAQSKFEMLSVFDLTGHQDEFEVVWSSVNNANVTYNLELTEDGHNWIPFEFGIPATGPTTIRIVPWISSTNNLFFRVSADRTWP